MKLLSLCIPGNDGPECIDAPARIPQASRGQDLNSIISFGITFILVAVTVISLGYLLWSGIRWVTSGGDKQRIQGARQGIIYALIGLLIVFFSFLIVNAIGGFFGVELLGSTPLVPPPGCGPGDPGPC